MGSILTDYIVSAQTGGERIDSAAELRSVLLSPEKLKQFLKPGFDADWFAAKYDMLNQADSCFAYYLENVVARRLAPTPLFDEDYYRSRYPDVDAEVAAGSCLSGYDHFLAYGRGEHRRPLANFDPDYYLAGNARVAEECASNNIDFYLHFARNRSRRQLLIEPPFSKLPIAEEAGKGIFERRAALVASTVTIEPRLDGDAVPAASIIVIARNKFPETVNAMYSILANNKATMEFILYDNGSGDQIADLPKSMPKVKYIRNETNIGFTTAVNIAAEQAIGRHIVLLNNDAEVGPGALDRAIERLDADPAIGAIGGRIIRTHGLLQEAGSIIWRDGSCLGYGRDLDPSDGRTTFLRDVDFCSGCFLVTPHRVWKQLEGFDDAFAPAYYEESDYCVRLWEAGLRVVYDPKILIWHFEFGSSGLRDEPIALMRRNRAYFRGKHKNFLTARVAPHVNNVEAARFSRVPGPRVLFIEDELPDARQGMGYVRSSDVVHTLESHAGHVTVCGVHPPKNRDPVSLREAFGERTEVLQDINLNNITAELRRRVGVYDALWLSRTHNLPLIRKLYKEVPEFFDGVRVILDTEAIASLRVVEQGRLLGQDLDSEALLDAELSGLELVSDICVVNAIDREAVEWRLGRNKFGARIHTLGHAIKAKPVPPTFDELKKITLTGSFFNVSGPNADGARWFDRHVAPILLRAWDNPQLLLAGFRAQEFYDHLDANADYGVMTDLVSMDPVYACSRIIVAPTRFAGGIPYKVHEACARGIPVVMTRLLGRQLGWTDDPALGIVQDDTPEAFAEMVIRMYSDPQAWHACRMAQLSHVEKDCDPAHFEETIRSLIAAPASA